MKYKEWKMPSGSPKARQALEAAGIPSLLAAILSARGITQPDQARLLLTGSEWELARGLTALEVEKLKSDQVLALLAAAEPEVAGQLTRNRRAAPVLRALKSCRDNAVYNVGAGHVLGWLCAELFREARG